VYYTTNTVNAGDRSVDVTKCPRDTQSLVKPPSAHIPASSPDGSTIARHRRSWRIRLRRQGTRDRGGHRQSRQPRRNPRQALRRPGRIRRDLRFPVLGAGGLDHRAERADGRRGVSGRAV